MAGFGERVVADAGKSIRFFTADEAFTEVAKPDGNWNWALVGPDLEKMPLVGGGPGSIAEMREAMTWHPVAFGILRLTFGKDRWIRHRFVYIKVLDVDNPNVKTSMVERGKVMAKWPAMEAKMKKYTLPVATIQVNSREDCTPENILPQLKSGATNADDNIHGEGLESYREAMALFRREKAFMFDDEEDAKSERGSIATEQSQPDLDLPCEPAAAEDAAARAPSPAPLACEEVQVKQRSKMRAYRPGEGVMVFSTATNTWLDDGVVLEFVTESCKRDGFDLVAGSVKVQYHDNKRYKWILPGKQKASIKPSSRPMPPPEFSGSLWQDSFWFLGTEKICYHVVLSNGRMQWWSKADDAKCGMTPTGSINLYKLEKQVNPEDCLLQFAPHKSRGAIHTFSAADPSACQTWWAELDRQVEFARSQEMYWREHPASRRSVASTHAQPARAISPRAGLTRVLSGIVDGADQVASLVVNPSGFRRVLSGILPGFGAESSATTETENNARKPRTPRNVKETGFEVVSRSPRMKQTTSRGRSPMSEARAGLAKTATDSESPRV